VRRFGGLGKRASCSSANVNLPTRRPSTAEGDRD
jgi:hypothetical protein